MVVSGCSWLASCCWVVFWVVVPGWQWLWFVPLIGLWCFFGSGLYMVAIGGCWV